MVTLDRQDIISTNKSLRLIKNELEHLLEKGVVNDDVFDQISRLLPAESSLSQRNTPAAAAAAGVGIAAPPTPTPAPAPQTPPVHAMANMALNAPAHAPAPAHSQNPSPAPPAYHQTGPPSLPVRGGGPTAPPPTKPVLTYARALYRYQAADDRDLSFERDDRVAVQEYMNEDWWMGRNERTGAEGIFPKNYVHVDQDYKQPTLQHQQQQQYAGYGGSPAPGVGMGGGYPPPPPGGQNPYNASVPPMAVAQGGGGDGQQQQEEGNNKMNEHGKKFGKKLGNAAIFGAGATIGSNLVNSIF